MEPNIKQIFRDKLNSITPIEDKEFELSFRFFKEMKLSKGQYFVAEGEVCEHIAFIVKGILRTYMVKENGDEATICFCTDGRVSTSLRSFTTQSESRLSIQAVEDTSLMKLHFRDLDHLYANTKAWPTIGRLLTEQEYLNIENYALGLNQQTAKEKYIRLLMEQPSVVQRAPVQQIASYLGVTRETLSRIRHQVASDNVTFVK